MTLKRTKENSDSLIDQAEAYLARILALRDHSKSELISKLSRKFKISRLESDDLLQSTSIYQLIPPDDVISQRWSEILAKKGLSARAIKIKLKTRGLQPLKLDQDHDLNAARLFVQKNKSRSKNKQTLARALLYRGFSSSTVLKILNEKSED